MEEFANLILNYGGTVILAALFIYIFIADRNDKKEENENTAQVLKELANSNSNIAESLNLLKTSIDTNTVEYRQHDERAIKQFGNINEHLIKIEEKLNSRWKYEKGINRFKKFYNSSNDIFIIYTIGKSYFPIV